jgi:hypothetical protein
VIKFAFFFFLSHRAYNVFRVLFYLFLFHPSTRGAAVIYHSYLKNKLADLSIETPRQKAE